MWGNHDGIADRLGVGQEGVETLPELCLVWFIAAPSSEAGKAVKVECGYGSPHRRGRKGWLVVLMLQFALSLFL